MSGNLDRRSFLTGLSGTAGWCALNHLSSAAERANPGQGPIAETQFGKVRGVHAKIISFRGIPYGGAVAGPARFLPPGPATSWKGIREVVSPGPRAMQLPDKALGGQNIFTSPILGPYFSGGRSDAAMTIEPQSENCLVLNVLTPALRGKRPVMIYIHGGGFAQGSGALTLLSDRLVAEEDVVLVGINHRLNIFGYTYLGDLDPKYADSGNAGQLDLIAALKWVRNNIANFGGDPANVTIFGESGGGAKIGCLMAMPGAKGLFHRAIIESGSARSVRTRNEASADTAKTLSSLGLTHSQLGELQTIDAAKLLANSARRISPVVDSRSVPHQTWAEAAPPESKGVPLLVGNCKDEATLASMSDPGLFSLDWDTLPAREVKAGIPEEKATALIAQYRADYPKDSPSDVYFRIATDRGPRRNAIAQAEAKLQQGDDVYMYNFAWDTSIEGGRLRAFHTSELPLAMRLVLNPEAEELSRQVAGAWAGFARSGDPNHSGLPRWDKYTLDRRSTMTFDAGKTALADHPAQAELALLQSYPPANP